MRQLSEKAKKLHRYITDVVDYARELPYEEWLEDWDDVPYMRKVYEDCRDGIVMAPIGYQRYEWDESTVEELRNAGLVQRWRNDFGTVMVRLIGHNY